MVKSGVGNGVTEGFVLLSFNVCNKGPAVISRTQPNYLTHHRKVKGEKERKRSCRVAWLLLHVPRKKEMQ